MRAIFWLCWFICVCCSLFAQSNPASGWNKQQAELLPDRLPGLREIAKPHRTFADVPPSDISRCNNNGICEPWLGDSCTTCGDCAGDVTCSYLVQVCNRFNFTSNEVHSECVNDTYSYLMYFLDYFSQKYAAPGSNIVDDPTQTSPVSDGRCNQHIGPGTCGGFAVESCANDLAECGPCPTIANISDPNIATGTCNPTMCSQGACSAECNNPSACQLACGSAHYGGSGGTNTSESDAVDFAVDANSCSAIATLSNNICLSGGNFISYGLETPGTLHVSVNTRLGSFPAVPDSTGVTPVACPPLGQVGINVSLESVDFPPTAVQEVSAPAMLTIASTGNAPLEIYGTSAQTPFATVGTLPLAIPPGTSAKIGITFSSEQVGSVSGSISITSNAPTSPTIIQVAGTGVPMTLTFPLENRGPYSALINTVFDHHVTTILNPPLPDTYCADDYVTAYTGEEGQRIYGVSTFKISFNKPKQCPVNGTNILNGFQKQDDQPFVVNGQYTGNDFLFYEGHPGFDYRTKDQARDGRLPVFASANGTLSWTGTCGDKYGTMRIDHGNGFESQYLHLDCSSFVGNNPRDVKRGDQIATSGDTGVRGQPHLHFELQQAKTPVDPYGWQSTDADPYTPAPRFPHVWRSFTEWISPWPAGGAPHDIRVDPHGNVWFDQEASECAIGKLAPAESGTFTFWMIGARESCTGGSLALETDTSGAVQYIWFTSGEGEILRLQPATGSTTIWQTTGVDRSIVVGQSGFVYVADSKGNAIARLDPNTNVYTQWVIPTKTSGVNEIKIAPTGPYQGHIFFVETTSNKIGKLDSATGRFVEWSLPSAGGPSGLFSENKNEVWFAEPLANKVAVINPIKNVISEFVIPTAFAGPTAVTKSAGNLLSFVEQSGNKVAALTQTQGTPQIVPRSKAQVVVPVTFIITPSSAFGPSTNFVVIPSHTATVPTLSEDKSFLEAKFPDYDAQPLAMDSWTPDPSNPHPSVLFVAEGINRIAAITLW